MLPHEKLEVDRKALAFVGDASTSAARWDKRPAVADQFGRASDNLVLNLAEGARLRPGRAKLRTVDEALGVRWKGSWRCFHEWEPKAPDDLQVGATPGRANDKGLDEDCDEGPTVAAENVQTPAPRGDTRPTERPARLLNVVGRVSPRGVDLVK